MKPSSSLRLALLASGFHVLALSTDGKVYTWGNSNSLQLGYSFPDARTSTGIVTAVDTSGDLADKTMVMIAAGSESCLALSDDGQLSGWGNNDNGQIAAPPYRRNLEPQRVDLSALGGKAIVSLSTSTYHTLAATEDGAVYAWGKNEFGCLGDGSPVVTFSYGPVPVDMSGVMAGERIISVAAGREFSLALSESGQLYTWGSNVWGQLGNGTLSLGVTHSLVPVAVDQASTMGGKGVIAIAIGGYHAVVMTDDSKVWAWGLNQDGQLGNGTTTESDVPVSVPLGGRNASSISAGNLSSAALLASVSRSGGASSSPSTFTLSGRRSYGANFGWMNWRWSSSSPSAPALTSDVLHGKVYCANTGWLDLGDGTPDDGVRYSQSNGDTGVNHDGTGALTGFAYASSIGWVTFAQSWQNPPRLNLATGEISGFAYSANTGWIRLNGLRTSLRHRDADLAGVGDGIDDAWEREQLAAAGRPVDLNLLGNSPGSDADSDGISDTDEYLADTNPFSSTSKPGAPEISGLNSDSLTLEWPASSRRIWQIECTADLSAWDDVGNPLTIPAGRTTGAATITLPPAAPRFFFRVSPMLPLTSP